MRRKSAWQIIDRAKKNGRKEGGMSMRRQRCTSPRLIRKCKKLKIYPCFVCEEARIIAREAWKKSMEVRTNDREGERLEDKRLEDLCR